ncbi:hypothetical protein HDU96_010870 [Phlyctochytrium bullatum]|nr:hypothetical protein HDU96_010870 [Phlyctochytrium bullatum]
MFCLGVLSDVVFSTCPLEEQTNGSAVTSARGQKFAIDSERKNLYITGPDGRSIYFVTGGAGGTRKVLDFDLPDFAADLKGHIASIQFIPDSDSLCIAFSNGDIVLLPCQDYDPSSISEDAIVGTVESGIVAMEWSPDRELFALITARTEPRAQGVLQLWTTSNYYWYLSLELSAPQGMVSGFQWDEEEPAKLYVAFDSMFSPLEKVLTLPSGGLIRIITLSQDVLHSASLSPDTPRTLAVIDGQKLNLTPFRYLNIPPPMYACDTPKLPSPALNEDVSKTMYPKVQARKAGVSTSRYKGKSSPLVNGRISQATEKQNKVCTAIQKALLAVNERKYITSILTADAKKLPPDLEGAMLRVKEFRDNFPEEAENAVKYLIFIADVDRLYDVALGMYDFALVMLVAQHSQKDPREYLPFLAELQKLPKYKQRFAIDDHLERRGKALTNLALDVKAQNKEEAETLFAKLLDYCSKYELHATAVDIFKDEPARLKPILCAFGDNLRSKADFVEAGLAYYMADEKSLALDAFKTAVSWEETLSIAYELPYSAADIAALAQELAGFSYCFVERGRVDRSLENDDVRYYLHGHIAPYWADWIIITPVCTVIKNRRKHERRRLAGKEGGVYEEEFLVTSLNNAVVKSNSLRVDIKSLTKALLQFGFIQQAGELQDTFRSLLDTIKNGMEGVFDNLTPAVESVEAEKLRVMSELGTIPKPPPQANAWPKRNPEQTDEPRDLRAAKWAVKFPAPATFSDDSFSFSMLSLDSVKIVCYMDETTLPCDELLSLFPTTPFHLPPADIFHKVPPSLRQKIALSARKINPLQELDLDEIHEGPEKDLDANGASEESIRNVDNGGFLSIPQLPQLNNTWRISVASSLLGGANDEMKVPSNDVVNKLTRNSIMAFKKGNPRASILMPITPGSLLGSEAPPMPMPSERNPSSTLTINPPKDGRNSPQASFTRSDMPQTAENATSLQPLSQQQVDNRISIASSVSNYSAFDQRLGPLPTASGRDTPRGGVPTALQQFRQQKEEEEERKLQQLTSQMSVASLGLPGSARGAEDVKRMLSRAGSELANEDGYGAWSNGPRDLEKPSGFELLRRAILAPTLQLNQPDLLQYIKSLSSVELGKVQRKIHAGALQSRTKSAYSAAIEVDRYMVDFKKLEVSVGVTAIDSLTLVSKTSEARFRFVFEQMNDERYDIELDPPSGVLTPAEVNLVIVLEVEKSAIPPTFTRATEANNPYLDVLSNPYSPSAASNVAQQPINQAASAEIPVTSALTAPPTAGQGPPYHNPSSPSMPTTTSAPPPQVSGGSTGRGQKAIINVMELDLVDDMIISGFPHRVPRDLALLRGALMASDGFSVDGIFGQRGTDNEMRSIVFRLKQGQQITDGDPYSIATCIQYFFRDSQHPLLGEIPSYLILGAYDEETAWEALKEVSPRTFDVLTWVLDLMADVVYYEGQNGMGARNICTTWAPHLYNNVGPNRVDQKTFIQVSMQLAPFVGMLLARRMMELDEF